MYIDMPLDALKQYLPARDEPADFDAFWHNTLQELRSFPLKPVFEPLDFGLPLLETFDVTFSGYAGQPVKGWLLLPRQRSGALPCVVKYIAYGGGRGFPHDWLVWANAGYAALVMDSRGQGSEWLNGDTPDCEPEGSSPSHPGFMTRGIFKPETYYFRRLYSDAVRAIETARSHPAIDGSRLAVTGHSQGGGVSLVVSGLVPDVQAVMPEAPFLCHIRRATEMAVDMPYLEIPRFLQMHRDKVETVFHTLSYFDALNFVVRAKAPALFSAGLMDETCPPSTVYAAYNHYAGEKQIITYTYNHHEAGGTHHTIQQIKYLQALWR